MTRWRCALAVWVCLQTEFASGQPPAAIALPSVAKPADEKSGPSATVAPQTELEKPKFPTATIGGAVQLDTGWFSQSPANRQAFGEINDGTSFRTTRLWAKGDLAENTGYQVEMDFGDLASSAPGRPNFQNVYVERSKQPYLGTVRIGRWKQPFSLETAATSIRFLTFVERASTFAVVPFRRTGIGFFDCSCDERWTWAASVFRAADDGYGDFVGNGNAWATAERLTHLLYDECDGARLLHVGAAHTWNAAANDTVRFRRFPEFAVGATPVGAAASITPNFFDTGALRAEDYNAVGAEFAWVEGPWSAQGEWMYAFVDRLGAANVGFQSRYVFVSYFLTGEHRNYNRQAGGFDRLKPRRNFVTAGEGCSGPGAWEIAARLSNFDANSKDVVGGVLDDVTLGLNWYWNPNAKMQFNWIHALPSGGRGPDSQADVFAIRMAYDF